jgi:hypothetical protein
MLAQGQLESKRIMPTKSNGPLMEDINRAIKAAKRNGWKEMTVSYPNGSEITIREGEETAVKAAAPATLAPPIRQDVTLLRLERGHKPKPDQRQEIFNEVETILRTGVLHFDGPFNRLVDELAKRGYTQLDGEPLIVKSLSRLLTEKGFNRRNYAPERLREKWAHERAADIRQLVRDGRLPREALQEIEPPLPEPDPDERPVGRW